MNSKVLIGAAALAAIVAVGAYITGSKESASKTSVQAPSEKLLAALDKRINDVARIQLQDAASSVTLNLVGTTWAVEQSNNYPAKFDSIDTLVKGAISLKKVEAKTSNPDNYERLEVQDPGPGVKGTLVEFSDKDGKRIDAVIIGKSYFPPGGSTNGAQYRFARTVGEKQSWLVEGSLNINTTVRNFLNTDVVDVVSNRVKKVVISHPDGEQVIASKELIGDANYTLETLPEGRELTSDARPNELGSMLSSVRFDEVVPASTVTVTEPVSVFRLTTFDGLAVEGRLLEQDGKKHLILVPSVDSDQIGVENATRQARAADELEANKNNPDFKPSDPVLIDVAAIEKEANELKAAVAPWAFILPSYMQERMARRNDFFLKAVEPAGPPAPELTTPDSDTTPTESTEGATAE